MVKNKPAMRETWFQSLGQEDLLEEEMAIHFSILAWKIPRIQEYGSLQSMEPKRVRGNWVTEHIHTIPTFSYSLSSWLQGSHCLVKQAVRFCSMVSQLSIFFPGSDSEESTYSCGRPGFNLWVRMIPQGGHGNPLQYSYLENLCGQRSLVGDSPWGYKVLDTTEWLSAAQDIANIVSFFKKILRKHLRYFSI